MKHMYNPIAFFPQNSIEMLVYYVYISNLKMLDDSIHVLLKSTGCEKEKTFAKRQLIQSLMHSSLSNISLFLVYVAEILQE